MGPNCGHCDSTTSPPKKSGEEMDARTTAGVRWAEKLSQVIGAWFELLKSSSVNFFYLPSLVGH